MIAQQTEAKQHTLDEIKRFKTKTYCPVTQMQKLNRALAEIINFDDPDTYMLDYLTNRYLDRLDLYHVNGRSGSLLPQEEPKNESLPTALTEEYDEGRQAYRDGQSMWKNPYSSNCESSNWHSGWWAEMESESFWGEVQ